MRQHVFLASALSVALGGGLLVGRQILVRATMPVLVSIGGEAASLVFTRTASASTGEGDQVKRPSRASMAGMSLLGAIPGLQRNGGSEADTAGAPSVVASPDGIPAFQGLGSVGAQDAQPPVTNPSNDPAPTSSCGAGMILVEGNYCPDVVHECKKWMETTGRYANYRCEEYVSAKCTSKERVPMKFCIARDEYVPPGESLPASHQSWNDASRICGEAGGRVCLESEYNFACEGEEMRPYPYGWKRDATACNADRLDIYRRDGKLRDLRAGSDDHPRCVSPFGVHNLAGNLEEWATIDASAATAAPRPAMKGAYWQPSRNHCRAAQTAHDRYYKGIETGFRCCADAK